MREKHYIMADKHDWYDQANRVMSGKGMSYSIFRAILELAQHKNSNKHVYNASALHSCLTNDQGDTKAWEGQATQPQASKTQITYKRTTTDDKNSKNILTNGFNV